MVEKIRPGASAAWLNLKSVSNSLKVAHLAGIIAAGESPAAAPVTPAPRARATARPQPLAASPVESDYDAELINGLREHGLLPDTPAPSNQISPAMPPPPPARPEPAGMTRPAAPVTIPRMASMDAATAVRLLASNSPEAQAAAARFYVRNPEAFLDAAQEAAKEQSPLQAKRQREQAEIEKIQRARGWIK